MKINDLTTAEGVLLTYAVNQIDRDKPWIVLVLPFGVKVAAAAVFFEEFGEKYNILTWQGRLIFGEVDCSVTPAELSVYNQASDLVALIDYLDIEKGHLVGYCSGAGVALQAVNKQPSRFEKVTLVHGEYALLKDKTCVTQSGSDLSSLLPIAAIDLNKARAVFSKLSKAFMSAENVPKEVLLPYQNEMHFYRYANFYVAYTSVDYMQLAQQVTHKTYLLSGDQDIQTNSQSTIKIAHQMANSEVYVDPQADHYGMLLSGSNTLKQIAECLK